MSRKLALSLIYASALILARSATAAVLVNDTWKDGTDTDPASPTYSELGTDSDADGDLESVWYQGGVGTLDPVGVGGPLRADLTGTGGSSATWTTYFTPDGSEVNLANNGDNVRITWSFTLSGVNANNSSQNFRFGVVDSGAKSTANGSLPSTTYNGYAVWGNMGQTLGNSNPFQLRERTAGSGNFLNTTGDFGNVLGNGATSGNAGFTAGTQYTLAWFMKRNGSSLDIDVSIKGGNLDGDGTAQVTVNDPSPVSFKFDTFGLRPSGETTTASVFDTTLFRVETNVPEPATAGLLGFAGLALAALRRRR
jgi:hypothetical protein